MERNITLISALAYGGISVTLAATFFVATTLIGKYPDIARYGGTMWVFLLSMIITMPTVMPFVKKRLGKGGELHG